MDRKITCINNNGMSITFGSSFAPYLLTNCDGIYEVKNKVNISDNTMIDGSTYQGSVTNKRNIVLTLVDKSEHQRNRYQLYALFKPKSRGQFVYQEGEDVRTIDYYVESIDISSVGKVRTATISLICPDPFFESPYDITVVMAGWQKNFKFVHAFQKGGEALGGRIAERLKVIDNDTGAEGVGLTIEIFAIGEVINPSITHIESSEFIKVGTETNPMTMVSGDSIKITTGTNNKHVYFTHNGATEEINAYLDEASDFIQLMSGTNTIGYDAESGVANMTVSISYRYKYLGV